MFIHKILLFTQIAADIDKIVNEKVRNLKKGESLQPFIIFVGNAITPEAYYIIVDNLRYKVSSALEALDLTFKIFFATDCEYPKACQSLWLFFQKVVYRISLPKDKSGVVLNKAFSFVEKDLKIKL